MIRLAIAVPGGLLLLWLLLAVPDGLTGWDLLAGIPAALLGLLAATRWPRMAHRVRHRLMPPQSDEPVGDPAALDASVPPTAMQSLLRFMAVDLHASRVAVWRLDTDRDRLVPSHVFGAELKPTSAAGNPLTWVVTEGGAMRMDPSPHWADGTVVATPVDARRVLTVEWPLDQAQQPTPAQVLRAGALLAPFLALHDQQHHALAATERVDRIIGLLRQVPGQDGGDRTLDGVARAAMTVLDSDGAVAAVWEEEKGVVVARAGDADGPRVGTEFHPGDGDLAHAARTGASVRRDSRSAPPLAAGTERWDRAPRHRVAVPLVDPDGTVRGVVGAWAASPLADHAIALVEAMGPLLALRLIRAPDLDRFRDPPPERG